MSQAPARRSPWTASRLLRTVALFALLAAFVALLSERHHRLFAVKLRGGELRVLRGRPMPAGFAAWVPSDAFLAKTYAPLPWPGEMPPELREATFAERDDLDRALFRALQGQVEQHLASQEPRRLGEALHLLNRASLLPGIESAQRTQLQSLQARLAWFQGRVRLDEAAAALREAAAQLMLASQSAERHAHEAGELLERIAPLSDQLARALRLPLGVTPLVPSTPTEPSATSLSPPRSISMTPPASTPTDPMPRGAPRAGAGRPGDGDQNR